MVLRRIRRFVPAEVAPDLLQEVFERVVRHSDTFEGRSSPVTWLYQIATRVCLHHLRDTRKRASLLEAWGAPVWSRPSIAADPETRAFLGQVWRQLGDDLTEIGAYHYIDGLTQAEIAEILGCSRRTVGNRLTELRKRVEMASIPGGEIS
ncbi:MAG: sigma-70 family RNA polymerase sigma factor [Rhodobacterales bacterium]|nr:sigma-70 family RNA polymerase sigma factor [Rhodobacterales bacterium]